MPNSPSAHSSPASADSISGWSGPVCALCGFASRTSSVSASLPGTGPGSLATGTYGNWRLTEEQKQQATRDYDAGESIGKVAKRYGVSRQGMHDVLKRRTQMRDRIAALPRKEPNAKRVKRAKSQRRYRERAARITAAQMRTVRERDQVCVKCSAEGSDFDHILPVSEGGQTTLDNLQFLCHPCHVEKGRADWKTRTRWKEVS